MTLTGAERRKRSLAQKKSSKEGGGNHSTNRARALKTRGGKGKEQGREAQKVQEITKAGLKRGQAGFAGVVEAEREGGRIGQPPIRAASAVKKIREPNAGKHVTAETCGQKKESSRQRAHKGRKRTGKKKNQESQTELKKKERGPGVYGCWGL